MFELWCASRPTAVSAELLDRIREAGTTESRAAARRLVAIGELFVTRLRDSGEDADWALDTWDAVAAQVGAALNCSTGLASSYLRYAMALRDRLPAVGKLFLTGAIDYRAFQTIVFRTDLINDVDTLARVDATLAVRLSRLPSLTRGRLAREVDRVVSLVDVDAVRRSKELIKDRFVDVTASETGIAHVTANVLDTVGRALDRRLGELAASVCDRDPRSLEQRRSDALGALAAGADRLTCACGHSGCGAEGGGRSNVVIYVVADQAAVQGRGSAPGAVIGAEGLVSAQLVAEVARTATLQPLAAPDDMPEPRYVPSAKLAAFVRCRDLTCRAPGCDRPAVECDLDHTVAYRDGGWTHASNLKALCRKHHLLKTFGGWRDNQLPDGTVTWQLPDGRRYVTVPGSALLFPSLCAPTGELPVTNPPRAAVECGSRTAAMPTRACTRAQNRAQRVDAERRHNRLLRTAAVATPAHDTAPPPF